MRLPKLFLTLTGVYGMPVPQHTHIEIFFLNVLGAREMVRWLRALAALPEILSSVPNNHIMAHKHL